MKFGIGQPVRRHEDLRLVVGRGRYTDDIALPRMTHAFVLRSPVAHAHLKRVEAAAAATHAWRIIGSDRRGRSGGWARRRAMHGAARQS